MDAPIDVLLQHWPGVLFRRTADLRFDFISPRIEEWTGHPAEAWLKDGSLFLRCVHEGDADRIREELANPVVGRQTTRFRLRHATTGRIKHISEFRRAIAGANGKSQSHEGFWQDESRLAHAEQRLESAAWKEVLSRLTPGFAHDFNNVIAGVHGLSDTFLSQLEASHPFHEGLALMRKKTLDASQLVQRLQQLHLRRTGERAFHDLNAIVKDTAELLARALGNRLDLVTDLASEQLPICADAAELQQVIFALAFNAADAMPERGRIVLRTDAHKTAPRLAHATGALPDGPCVSFSTQDDGHGVSPRDVGSLFAPEFTTKPGRHGWGVGLHHARRFAERHNGAVSIESSAGNGATFTVWLPKANLGDGADAAGRKQIRTVLLAGQQPRKLDDTAQALRACELRVVVADGDAEALLVAPEFELDAVLLRATVNDSEAARVVQFIRRHRLPVRLAVQPVDCGEEDLDPKLLEKADLVLAESVSPERAAERIAKELFAR